MQHFWVSFEAWAPAGDCYYVVPFTWVDAETLEHAELLARRKLGDKVKDDVVMTTCVAFSEEDYQREMRRQRDYFKSLPWHPSHFN